MQLLCFLCMFISDYYPVFSTHFQQMRQKSSCLVFDHSLLSVVMSLLRNCFVSSYTLNMTATCGMTRKQLIDKPRYKPFLTPSSKQTVTKVLMQPLHTQKKSDSFRCYCSHYTKKFRFFQQLQNMKCFNFKYYYLILNLQVIEQSPLK